MNVPQEQVSDLLTEDVDEARIQQIWRATETRVFAPEKPTVAKWAVGGGLALAAAVFVGAFFGQPGPPAYLTLEDGGPPVRVTATETDQVVKFSDHSVLTVHAGASLVPTTNVEGVFRAEQPQGRVRYEITPDGPRRWVIDAGLATVEVLGTKFEVLRDAASLEVRVERGRVEVSGELVNGGAVILGAGQSVRIVRAQVSDADADADADAETETDAESESESETETETETETEGEPNGGVAWRVLAEEGNHEGAYEELGAPGVTNLSSSAGPRDLMLLADVARLSGHSAEAVAPLERLLERFPGNSRAPLAAIVLGRVEMSLGNREKAIAAFAHARSLGVPSALEEDVARRVERLRAGE